MDFLQLLERVVGRELFSETLQFTVWAYPRMQALFRLQSREEIVRALEQFRREAESVPELELLGRGARFGADR